MRDEAGVKFQTVLHQYSKADYEGVISVENEAKESATGLVYWVAGAEAACPVNKTIENKVYDGEYTVKASHTQAQLADAIRAGKLMLHSVGSEIRILTDSNTLVTYTEEKGEDFSNNQTVRVLDQIGNDVASLFHTRYLGKISNDDAGRVSLWNDIVTYGNSWRY
ncbi:phage tail sheath subtilisin-like domain-containing protein [Lacrimispora sphenoides]|uniref:phage tail sheath subtilisin-like domain-containing protein n=1 Tax=Lacrimispora sphenoides TaxID=29370 RepID=UPI001FA8B596|nr:phage tail sheath subtilisin-like domain-containing protein [Lacrimispora sphenoides]